MGGGGSAYVVCAQLQGNFPSAESHDATAGQPIHRRINRMERVALAYGGNLVRRAGDMLLVSFATANAAALAACEMQRRCRSMPKLANFPTHLHVGVHRAAAPRTVPSDRNERRDINRRLGFTVAQTLADKAEQDSVVASGLVIRALDPSLRERCRLLPTAPLDTPAFQMDWEAMLLLQTPVSIQAKPGTHGRRRLLLRKETSRLMLDRPDVTTTLGRDPACDIIIADHLVSREHAHIELLCDRCLLTDHSTNGTSVVFHSGHQVLLRNETIQLEGSGRISLGRSMDTNPAGVIEFRILNG